MGHKSQSWKFENRDLCNVKVLHILCAVKSLLKILDLGYFA